jgi:hypothetical protein
LGDIQKNGLDQTFLIAVTLRQRTKTDMERVPNRLAAQRDAILPTTEMLATPHGGGHHALRILAAAASNSWIESTNSKNTSRGDANIGSCCCSIASSSPITRLTRAFTSRVIAWRSTGTREDGPSWPASEKSRRMSVTKIYVAVQRELRRIERDDYLFDLEGVLRNKATYIRPSPGRFREDERQHLTVQCPCVGASRVEAEQRCSWRQGVFIARYLFGSCFS